MGAMSDDSSSEPVVSVLLAVYNGVPAVHQAIDSILEQTFRDFELLILDDASTDGTWDLLQAVAAQDARVRLLRHDRNEGLTRSLNEMLAVARGRYIARQDADDLSLPDRLARQVAVLEARPDAVLVTGNYAEIDPDGTVVRTIYRDVPPRVTAWVLLFHNTIAAHSLVMLRREAVRRAGGYDETYTTAQDYALWLRLMDLGDLVILPDVLLRLRQRPGSISDVRRQEQHQNAVRAAGKKLSELTGRELTAQDVESLFGFWAPWRLPARQRLGAFDRLLRMVYRAFCTRYQPSPAERIQIRRATARQYATWMERQPGPLVELRLSTNAARWHLGPVLSHWRANGLRWLARCWTSIRTRLGA